MAKDECMKIMPFNGDLTLTLFNEIINNVHKEIMALENDYIIKAPETELEQYYIKKAHIEPLNLDINKMYIENRYGTKIDVSKYPDRVSFSGKKVFVQGTILEIAIPYDGDRRLWQTRSTVYKMDLYPDITVENDRIIFKVSLANDSADVEEIKNDIEYYKKVLTEAIIRLNKDVEGYNKTVPNIVKEKLRHKKQQAKNTIIAIEKLNIPIKRRKEPLTYIIHQ